MGAPVRTPVAGVYADSVAPVVEAGLAKLIKIDGTEFLDGISFHPTPGHSKNDEHLRRISHRPILDFPGLAS